MASESRNLGVSEMFCFDFTFDRILGIVSFVLTIVIYLRQTKAQEEFEKFSIDTFELLKKQGMLTQHHLISLRTNFLHLFYEQSPNKFGYWHFKFRFECWDEVGIYIKSEENVQRLDLKILGQTIDHTLEATSTDRNAYVCSVLYTSGPNFLDISIGEKVVCFNKGETKCISKYYHPVLEPEEWKEFGIGRLGSIVVGSQQDKLASELKIYDRIKDSIAE